jgi:hypothetical protein
MFRKDMLLGRILRFLGEFEASRVHLESARARRRTSSKILSLMKIFFATLPAIMWIHCESSTTLVLLSVNSEQKLCAKINWACHHASLYWNCHYQRPCLFAQGRLDEAEELCIEIESRAGLLQMERLHLFCYQGEASPCSV